MKLFYNFVVLTAFADEKGIQPTDSVALDEPISITIRAFYCEEDINDEQIILPSRVYISTLRVLSGSMNAKKCNDITFLCYAADEGEHTYGTINVGKN